MEDSIKMRDYNHGDYEGIMYVWENTGLGNKNRGDNEEIIEKSIAMGGKLIVLENSKNEIIGTSWITFDGRRYHLHHIGVLTEYRNKGYGKQLTIESIRFAKDKGIQIKLEVHQSNLNAIELYKKIGFTYLGDYDVYIIRSFENINL